MDRDVIAQKLESLRRCLQRVKEKCPANSDDLVNDPDAQDIVTLNLTRAIQICVDIGAHLIAANDALPPNTMGETFDRLAEMEIIDSALANQLKKAVGFRNVAIHNYHRLAHRAYHCYSPSWRFY